MPGTLNVGGHDIITHSGDAGAGDVTVYVQNRLVLDSSGNVGIGTTPSYKLDITGPGTAGASTLRLNDSASAADSKHLLLTRGATTAYVGIAGSQANDPLIISRSGNYDLNIDNSGNVGIGQIPTLGINGVTGVSFSSTGYMQAQRDGSPSSIIALNRSSTDGDFIRFYQANSLEGSISVSGSTASFNGGHLSRWSQFADNTRDESIVKGTVMSNLDQMAEWTNDGVTEENEQLNCTKVSDVEGDPNVAGVFVNWDNNDDIYINDMYIAMTGDMVIRIAQGTTVQRGDLLMSAGDGTAKPQGDDIVRSKTIAKVTSTHVSHTYEDGSYLVPCVLMAC